jgi:hypothetical protein
MEIEAASFRDPSGQVFHSNGSVFRSVYASGAGNYETVKISGIYDKLIEKGYLIPHKEVETSSFPEGTVYCLEHPKIQMISYPWEWSFSMLKDAALLHLDIMEYLMPMGFWLRDANAFNVQYHDGKLLLIDTLSIGKREEKSPWVAYNQFCTHFLAPLAVAAYSDIRALGLWRSNINGIPLDLAANLLPGLKKFRPGLCMHLTLHARFQQHSQQKRNLVHNRKNKQYELSDKALYGLIRSLKSTISNIRTKLHSNIWASYGGIRTYEPVDITQKTEFIRSAVAEIEPKSVWDLGGNTGEFSAVASEKGALVVSVDGDPACTDFLYRKMVVEPKVATRILPLTMDLANPSPALGWAACERKSLMDRGPADLVLALALVHHLVFSSNIPLFKIAEWFAAIGKHCLVEFILPVDPMVLKLTENRKEHHPYSMVEFRTAFGGFFELIESVRLENGRTLFLFRKKQTSS